MLIRTLVLAFAVAIGATGASAATLNVVGGELLGASNVDVGGQFYDVAFVDGTCAALFGGCDATSDFTFTSFAAATAASQALLDQVFVDIGGNFDSQPELTNGCSFTGECIAQTPYNPFTSVYSAALALNDEGAGVDGLGSTTQSVTRDTTGHIGEVFAVWTLVPEPTTGLLMAGGLALMSARRRPAAGR